MPQVAHGGSGIHGLPTDLLAGILQHVEQKDRLQFCAMVCKRWQQASNMATSRVIDAAGTKQGIEALSAWLHSNTYASSVQGIQLQPTTIWKVSAPVLQLPLHRLACLEELKLGHCQLKATPAQCSAQTTTCPAAASASATTAAITAHFSSLAALTALSRLQLGFTELDLGELGSCTGLRHLDLNMVCHATTADPAAAEIDARYPHWRHFPPQLGAALPQLTQLTYLDLHFSGDQQPAAAASLSSLQHLRSLKLSGTSVAAIDLSEMPTTLTSLQLGPPLRTIAMPCLRVMPQLQHLHLYNIHLEPMSLSNATQLTWLQLIGCDVEAVEAVNGLILALGQMKQLKHLGLNVTWFAQDGVPFANPELLAAVTASRHLTFLDLKHCDLPVGANIHVFSVADALKDLKVLKAGSALFSEVSSFERLVVCCPTLEQLDLELEEWMEHPEIQHIEDIRFNMQGLSALHHLPALTTLSIREIEITDDAMRSVAACTQLMDLTLSMEACPPAPVTATTMMTLTQLTRLTKLDLLVGYEDGVIDEYLVSDASLPKVYVQLKRYLKTELQRQKLMYYDD